MNKNISIIISVCLLGTILSSCNKDFLDKAPGIDINEDKIFSTRVETEKYVATLYQYGMSTIFPIRPVEAGFGNSQLLNSNIVNGSWENYAVITDEAVSGPRNGNVSPFNIGGVLPNNITRLEDSRYYLRWQAIRVANILIERVDQVPDADITYKENVKGEALFIRALNNFEMLKRYGGFPLVTKRIVTLEESRIPRSTFEQCVNAILKDCDDAVTLLPSDQTILKGRVHDGAALALKARTLLYAASPLFNTATPISSYGNTTDDKLICYGNFDIQRWKLAADAAKAVLVWASTNGYALIDVPANRIPTVVAGQKVTGNYRYAWEIVDNEEMILTSKIYGAAKSSGSWPWQHLLPRNNYVQNSGGTWNGPSVTFNFVRKYQKRDGTPQVWDYNGGNDLLQKYVELDGRFSQSVVYSGARLHNNVVRTPIGEWTTTGSFNSGKANCEGGHWILKFVNDGIGTAAQVPNNPIFRLNEMYLNYAEAMNEFEGPGTGTSVIMANVSTTASLPQIPNSALDAVNKIRLRSGMPPLTDTDKGVLRTKIHNERDIELFLEDHRLVDCRRWLEAEDDGVMKGSMWGLEINRLNTATPYPTALSYKPFVFQTRTFPRKLYIFPFYEIEVLKGNLKQNPGW